MHGPAAHQHRAATNAGLKTAGGDFTPEKGAAVLDRQPEAVSSGEKMDFVPVRRLAPLSEPAGERSAGRLSS